MNALDIKIFQYLENPIVNRKNNDDLYQKFNIAINKKLYSDINVQDDEGNTFLHLVMKNKDFYEADRFLRLGADPYIKNSKDFDCFQICPHILEFKEKYANFFSRQRFHTDSWGFHDKFKDYLIRINPYAKFNNKEDFKIFTDKNNYITQSTYLDLLDLSIGLNNTQKIEIFLEGSHNKEENTFFLAKISKKIYSQLNPLSLSAYEELLQKEFSDNKNLHEAILSIFTPKHQISLKSEKLKSQVMELFMEKILSSDINLDRKLRYSHESVRKYLEQNVNELYFSKKLSLSLVNHHQSKIMKI